MIIGVLTLLYVLIYYKEIYVAIIKQEKTNSPVGSVSLTLLITAISFPVFSMFTDAVFTYSGKSTDSYYLHYLVSSVIGVIYCSLITALHWMLKQKAGFLAKVCFMMGGITVLLQAIRYLDSQYLETEYITYLYQYGVVSSNAMITITSAFVIFYSVIIKWRLIGSKVSC